MILFELVQVRAYTTRAKKKQQKTQEYRQHHHRKQSRHSDSSSDSGSIPPESIFTRSRWEKFLTVDRQP